MFSARTFVPGFPLMTHVLSPALSPGASNQLSAPKRFGTLLYCTWACSLHQRRCCPSHGACHIWLIYHKTVGSIFLSTVEPFPISDSGSHVYAWRETVRPGNCSLHCRHEHSFHLSSGANRVYAYALENQFSGHGPLLQKYLLLTGGKDLSNVRAFMVRLMLYCSWLGHFSTITTTTTKSLAWEFDEMFFRWNLELCWFAVLFGWRFSL